MVKATVVLAGDALGTRVTVWVAPPPGSDHPSVADLRAAFPFPGRWHFRTRVAAPKAAAAAGVREYVWRDLADDAEPLPVNAAGTCTIKATPVSVPALPPLGAADDDLLAYVARLSRRRPH